MTACSLTSPRVTGDAALVDLLDGRAPREDT